MHNGNPGPRFPIGVDVNAFFKQPGWGILHLGVYNRGRLKNKGGPPRRGFKSPINSGGIMTPKTRVTYK